MSRRVFTADEDAALIALVALGKTSVAIGLALGRAESSISSRIKALALKASRPTPKEMPAVIAKPKKTIRPCLCCGNDFTSDGPHNRLCNTCRKQEKTRFVF